MDSQVITMINKNVETLRTEVREEFKQVNQKLDNMVSKEQCQANRNNCNKNVEWSVKKITAISGAVTGILTASGTLILIIAKIFGYIG
jgi:ABC-type phosphate transport system auxiliary subunit